MSPHLELVPSAQPDNEAINLVHRFGPWALNLGSNQLTNGDKLVELEQRLTVLLGFFLQNRNLVLSKDDILKAIWQRKIVNDDSLAVAVSQLRKALGDNPRAPTYIKTIPGVGYQFIYQEQVVPEKPPETPPAKSSRRFHKVLAFGFAASLLVGTYSMMETKAESEHKESDAYTKATALLATGDKDNLRSAIPLFRSLLDENPQAAEAYLGIAEAKIKLVNGLVTELDNDEEIRALLNKALAINPNLARAHMWLGQLLLRHDHNLRAAEDHFRTSLALNPKDDLSHFLYEQFLLVEKRFDEAREQITLAREINPLSYPYTYLVWVYMLERKNDLAVHELNRIASTEMGDSYYHTAAQNVYFNMGEEQKVYEHMRWFFNRNGYTPEKIAEIDKTFAQGGLKSVYQRLLQEKSPDDVGQYRAPLSWARYAVALGKHEEAINYLEEAYTKHQFQLLCAITDPRYDPLRNEPRFQQLLAKLTQPRNAVASR